MGGGNVGVVVVYNAGVGAGRVYLLRGLGCGGLSAWGWRGWRSGTTLRAAADLGRRAIEIEINPEYCGLIRRRRAQAVLPMEG